MTDKLQSWALTIKASINNLVASILVRTLVFIATHFFPFVGIIRDTGGSADGIIMSKKAVEKGPLSVEVWHRGAEKVNAEA